MKVLIAINNSTYRIKIFCLSDCGRKFSTRNKLVVRQTIHNETKTLLNVQLVKITLKTFWLKKILKKKSINQKHVLSLWT